jgi:hypothetical protein
VKIPRNGPCPCGSGKKFKRCCGKPPEFGSPPPADTIAAVTIDHEEHEVIYVTKDMLVNQLTRDAPQIAESFDKLHRPELLELSEVMARSCAMVFKGHRHAIRTGDEFQRVCTNLLFNALNSFMGATTLLRQGFYLQCATLVRSLLEQVATVLHLVTAKDDLDRFKRGDLSLTAILRGAKTALPPFGQLYGFFSEKFVHMSPLHASFQPLLPYENRSDQVDANIGFLRTADWLILVTAELLYLDLEEKHDHWQRLDKDRVAYNPSPSIRAWQERFLRFPRQ